MKNKQLLYLFTALTILASCKKDDSKTKAVGIDGTYTFNGMHAMTNTTTINDNGVKIIQPIDWTSANNQGTIVFDNGQETNTNFGYSINAPAETYYYHDNLFVDSLSSPLVATIPATNSVSTYQLIGSDSIYFPKGGFVGITSTTGGFVDIGSTATTSNPGGGHYQLSGNQLTLTLSSTKDSTFSFLGVMYKVQQSVVSSIVLLKQ